MTLNLELLIPSDDLYNGDYYKSGSARCKFGEIDIQVFDPPVSNTEIFVEIDDYHLERSRFFEYDSQDALALLSQMTKLSDNITASYQLAVDLRLLALLATQMQ